MKHSMARDYFSSLAMSDLPVQGLEPGRVQASHYEQERCILSAQVDLEIFERIELGSIASVLELRLVRRHVIVVADTDSAVPSVPAEAFAVFVVPSVPAAAFVDAVVHSVVAARVEDQEVDPSRIVFPILLQMGSSRVFSP